MKDNLELIRPLLKFESKDDFYYLQILQRKKENPQLGSNSRVIKNYYIRSEEYLDKRYDEIKLLCRTFNARAMLRLNKRSFEKVAYKTLINISHSMSNGEHSKIYTNYDKGCGQTHNDKNKTWILDIDGEMSYEELFELEEVVNNSLPEGKNTICYIPSKNGMHLITKPFDQRLFSKLYPEIDVHKDNPTNLYIS